MNKSILAAFPLLAMAALSSFDPLYREEQIPVRIKRFSGRKFNQCPKGCNHYRFNKIGYFTINKKMDRQEHGECIYECFAINDKKAKAKFEKLNKAV